MPTETKIERRFLGRDAGRVAVEERQEGEGSRLSGYAAIYYDGTPDTEYEFWSGFVERIMPGAFDRAIREDDVRGLFNHDPHQILGRTRSGTLSISSDDKGLRYEIEPPDTHVAGHVVEAVRREDVTGSSFAFLVTDEDWRMEDGVRVREIQGVQLFDVGPVTFPAYEATEAEVSSRSLRERMAKALPEPSKGPSERVRQARLREIEAAEEASA